MPKPIDPKDHLSTTLKTVRSAQDLSLDAAAQKTGVSKAMLGQIERGESSPTVATLWKIATGLGVSLSTFIEPPPADSQATIIRTADAIRQHPANDGLLISPLFPFESHLGFEYLELSFESGYHRISSPHQTGVVEIISVIQGQMEILADGNWHPIRQGQSIRFAGDKAHGYRNMSAETAKVITVIHYAQGRTTNVQVAS